MYVAFVEQLECSGELRSPTRWTGNLSAAERTEKYLSDILFWGIGSIHTVKKEYPNLWPFKKIGCWIDNDVFDVARSSNSTMYLRLDFLIGHGLLNSVWMTSEITLESKHLNLHKAVSTTHNLKWLLELKKYTESSGTHDKGVHHLKTSNRCDFAPNKNIADTHSQ